MKKVILTLYSFDELSKEVQDKAINNLATINVEHEWWEYIYDDAKNVFLNIKEFDLDHNKHAKGEFMKDAMDTATEILKHHDVGCEIHKIASNYIDDYNALCNPNRDAHDSDYQELENSFEEELLEEYASILQKEYNYLMGRESIIETINANEYTFEEDGSLNNGNSKGYEPLNTATTPGGS